MLAIAPGCELDVERGPDWLLVRVRNLEHGRIGRPSVGRTSVALLQQHFTYRLVLELDGVGESEQLFGRTVARIVPADRRARRRDAVVRAFAAQSPRSCTPAAWTSDCCPTRIAEEAVMGRHWARPAGLAAVADCDQTPADFQFVGDFVDAIDVSNGLLSHLLLEVRVDHAPQGDAAGAGLKT